MNTPQKWDSHGFLNLGNLEWNYGRNSFGYEQFLKKIKTLLGYDYGGEGLVFGMDLELGLCWNQE